MTYTQVALLGVAVAVAVDLWGVRTRLLRRRVFWTSYAIIVFFQLISNGMFTGFNIVRYDGDAIIGSTSPDTGSPTFLGDGRIAFAPVEDLLFGFALVLLSLSAWVWLGRRGIQREPMAGPPMWRTFGRRKAAPDGPSSPSANG